MNKSIRVIALLIITPCISALDGCGGDTSTSGSTDSRSLTPAVYDVSNKECSNAREATQEQPLSTYIARLTELADAGLACAQFGLGTLYRTGYDSTEKNLALSQRYLSDAAAQGHPGAVRLLEKDGITE